MDPAEPATGDLPDTPLPCAADGAEPPRPDPAGEPPDESPTAEPPRPARDGPRDGAFVDSDAADPDAVESAALDPDDPPDPVVSANATGTDATAEPTPNATANAPTRPTNGAKLDDPTSVAVTARRPYSIARTRPRDTRR